MLPNLYAQAPVRSHVGGQARHSVARPQHVYGMNPPPGQPQTGGSFAIDCIDFCSTFDWYEGCISDCRFLNLSQPLPPGGQITARPAVPARLTRAAAAQPRLTRAVAAAPARPMRAVAAAPRPTISATSADVHIARARARRASTQSMIMTPAGPRACAKGNEKWCKECTDIGGDITIGGDCRFSDGTLILAP